MLNLYHEQHEFQTFLCVSVFLTAGTVPLETMGPFAANLPRSIRGFDLRFHLGKTSSNRNKNLGFTWVFFG